MLNLQASLTQGEKRLVFVAQVQFLVPVLEVL